MADLGELDPRARALLNAYRDDRGPSDAVAARLRAAVQRDVDAMADRPGDPAPVVPHRRARRWLGPAVLTALAAAVVAALALRPGSPRRDDPAAAAAPWQAPTPTPDAAIHRRPPAPPVPPPASPAASTEPARGSPAPSKARPRGHVLKTSKPTADDLAAEMSLMRPAQLALAEERPADALALLDRYLARFPDGLLREEHQALHAAALCAAGRTREGHDEARTFLREHAGSLFAPRIRAACSLETAPESRPEGELPRP